MEEGEGDVEERGRGGGVCLFKQKTAYEITTWLEFRRVLFRSSIISRLTGEGDSRLAVRWRRDY